MPFELGDVLLPDSNSGMPEGEPAGALSGRALPVDSVEQPLTAITADTAATAHKPTLTFHSCHRRPDQGSPDAANAPDSGPSGAEDEARQRTGGRADRRDGLFSPRRGRAWRRLTGASLETPRPDG